MTSLTVCAMPGCPALTKGNYCARHADMTDEQEATEIREMRRRSRRYDDLRQHALRLRAAGADDDAISEADEQAEEAHLDLAELFGDPTESDDE